MRIALLSAQLTLESGAYGLENHMTSQAEEQCGPSCGGGDKSGSLNRRNLDSRHLRRRGIIIRKLEYTIDRDTTYGRVSRHLRSFLYNLFPEFFFLSFRPP